MNNANLMRLSKPKLVSFNGELKYQVRVFCAGVEETLWYSVRQEYCGMVTNRSDAALVGLLVVAMSKGCDIQVGGVLSERLFYNLSNKYQALLKVLIPKLRKVKIFPDEISSSPDRPSGVATGFSGGIDSFCVLADHYYNEALPGFRLTHLFFNNVGSHGPFGERLFRKRYARLLPVADRLGLPLIEVNSNLDMFYADFSFQQTHTLRNVSVALLLQSGIGRFMYSSGYNYAQLSMGPFHDMALADPVALPLLSTDGMDAISEGSQYTRVQKTLIASKLTDSYKFLDVCVVDANEVNCSACMKCMRTLLTLDIAGCLGRYASAFNLETYRMNRPRYVEEVLQSRNPLLSEIVDFAEECGISLTCLQSTAGR